MTKLQTPEIFLASLAVPLDGEGIGMIMGRNTRLVYTGIFQIGDDNFDRWANSVELEFDLSQAKGQRQFLRWLNSKFQ